MINIRRTVKIGSNSVANKNRDNFESVLPGMLKNQSSNISEWLTGPACTNPDVKTFFGYLKTRSSCCYFETYFETKQLLLLWDKTAPVTLRQNSCCYFETKQLLLLLWDKAAAVTLRQISCCYFEITLRQSSCCYFETKQLLLLFSCHNFETMVLQYDCLTGRAVPWTNSTWHPCIEFAPPTPAL